MDPAKQQSLTSVLRTWAALGRILGAQLPNWEPAVRMIKAARRLFEVDARRLKELLNKSNERLHPLADPMSTDFGVHRWLSDDREEAYSDWLAWIISQIECPLRIVRLFGIAKPEKPEQWRKIEVEVGRELPVPRGHEGREGRLDLWIRFRDRAIVVVEVKKQDADEADIEKHKGYLAWLRSQPEPRKIAILLASEGSEDSYCDFQLCTWAELCVELRRMAPLLCKDGRFVPAAMILAFVGAVEQNLLAFSASTVKDIVDRRMATFDPRIVEHLERSLAIEGES